MSCVLAAAATFLEPACDDLEPLLMLLLHTFLVDASAKWRRPRT
jgi:hypothetical protein